MKTLNDALKYFAEFIWKCGESKEKGCQCIIPFAFNEEITTYEKASKIIHDEIKATHFDRAWNEKGKSVILKFYRGNGFGACLDMKFLCEKIVTFI
jgi:hypothetical protein